MNEKLTTFYYKKLYMKAKRRGLIELDLTLGYIADVYLHNMSKNDVDIFAELLDKTDEVLLKWLLRQEVVPKKFQNIWQLVDEYKNSIAG